MRNALETSQYRIKARNDFMGGIRSGVNGPPEFFINGVAMMVLKTTPPWCRQSRRVPPKAETVLLAAFWERPRDGDDA
jgi:hypothetical protein